MYVLEYDGIAIDAKEAGVCTARFFNGALDKIKWNCKFKLVKDKVLVVTTRDVEHHEELFLAYGWEFWWNRRLSLSKSVLGMAARAYPEISELLNAGRSKLTKKKRLRTKRIKGQGPKLRPTRSRSAGRRKQRFGNASLFPRPLSTPAAMART